MSERLDPKIWRTVAVVFLGPFMTQIDSPVVNVSMSMLRDQLHSTIDTAQWVISCPYASKRRNARKFVPPRPVRRPIWV